MPSKPFTRGIELRQKLKAARSGEVITLPLKENDFGEYEGPLVLDRPVTLIGRGDKTPLTGRGCPALIVLSAGVRLENLELSDSFDPSAGVCLLVEEKAQPVLVNEKLYGRKETMSREHLVDLGELLPHQQVSSYFEVEVSGPSQVKCTENSSRWLRVLPDTLPAAGKHLLQLMCDSRHLGADAIAVGCVEIITATTTRTIWVTAHVLTVVPANLLRGAVSLLIGKDQRIRFAEGFLIGKNKFPGLTGANTMAERQAIVLKEAGSSDWAIFQPWQTPSPTLVNGQPMAQGQRIMLQEGLLIRAGNLEMKAETAVGSGSFSVNPAAINLTQAGSPGFQLRYNLSGKDKAKIVVTVPWAQVTPTEVDVKKDEIKTIAVSLAPAAASLPPGKRTERGGILVVSKNEIISLDTSLETQVVEVVDPILDTPEVIFKDVEDINRANPVTLAVRNQGAKDWQAAVRLAAPWIDLVGDKSITIAAGATKSLVIQLNNQLPGGDQDLPDAVVIEGEEKKLSVRVKVKRKAVVERPAIRSAAVTFGETPGWRTAPGITLPVYNDGNKDWNNVQVSVDVPWITVTPQLLAVAKGGQANLEVKLNEAVNTLASGQHEKSDAILLKGGGIQFPIAVKLTLAACELRANLAEIALTASDDTPLSSVQQKIVVTNFGRRDWTGKISSALPWLKIDPPQAEIGVTGTLNVVVGVTEAVRSLGAGEQSFSRAILFENTALELGVRLVLMHKPQEVLDFASPTLDFGKLEVGAGLQTNRKTLSIRGSQDWQAALTSQQAWFRPISSSCGGEGGKRVDVLLELTQEAQKLGEGVHWGELGLVTRGGTHYSIPVRIEFAEIPPDLVFEPPSLEFKWLAVAGMPPGQKLRITNRNNKEWKIGVDAAEGWLNVSPQAVMTCPPMRQVEFELSLPAQVSAMKDGLYQQNLTIRIDKYKQYIPVTMTVDHTTYDWKIEPEGISFGIVEKDDNWDSRLPEEVTVRNNSALSVHLSVQVVEGSHWLDVPGGLQMHPRSERKLQIGLKQGAWNFLKLGQHRGVIELTGAGKPVTILATLTLVSRVVKKAPAEPAPSVEMPSGASQGLLVEPQRIVFEKEERSRWRDVPPQKIKVTNPGQQNWVGRVQAANWLIVQPLAVNLAPFESIQLEVRLKPPSAFARSSADLFSIENNRGKRAEEDPLPDETTGITLLRGTEAYPVQVSFGGLPAAGAPPVQPTSEPERTTPVATTAFNPNANKPARTAFSGRGASTGSPQPPAVQSGVTGQPPNVNFGRVIDWNKTAPQSLTLFNNMDQAVTINVSTESWFNAAPDTLICSAHGSIDFQISLRRRSAFALPKERVWEPRGIVITYGDQTLVVPVVVEVS